MLYKGKSKWTKTRVGFLQKYRGLSKRIFEGEGITWNSPAGKRFLQLARKQLKYRPTYTDGDLFCSFNSLYHRIWNKKK